MWIDPTESPDYITHEDRLDPARGDISATTKRRTARDANVTIMGTAYAYGHANGERFRITRARTSLNGTVLEGRRLDSGKWVRLDDITTQ